jgi:hypothetical protein
MNLKALAWLLILDRVREYSAPKVPIRRRSGYGRAIVLTDASFYQISNSRQLHLQLCLRLLNISLTYGETIRHL